ncbi:hypothetical protein ACHAPJ_009098 [Fusarium lateritium]
MIHHSDSKTPADQTPPSQEDRDQSVEATSVLPTHPEDFLTRNGLNLTSFRRRKAEDGAVDLDRKIKKRHLNMIALGGSIGAGLFVGSGSALSKGGPASLLIDFSIIGIMIFNVVYALGELCIMYPVASGFYTFSARFIHPAWGFAMGWNYVFQWVVVLPLELTVASITIQYWNDTVSPGVWITLFLVAIIFINIFGTLGYAEEEFFASLLKLMATIIFMIIALVMICGGGPSSGRYDYYQGGKLWQNPGAFRHGFKGFCSAFITAAFSFSGTELVGLAAAESENPTRSLPRAIKKVFWRVVLFYILSLALMGLLIESTDPNLLSSGSYASSNSSPFVLVGKYAGLQGYDDFMNIYVAIAAPVGEIGLGTAEDFFKQCLALPIILAFFICGYFWQRQGWIKTSDIDVESFLREHDWVAIKAERQRLATRPAWRRVWDFFF